MTLLSAAKCAKEIDACLSRLLDVGVVLYYNTHSAVSDEVRWRSDAPSAEPFLLSSKDVPTHRDYQYWYGSNMFSAILVDGSLLQLSYKFKSGILDTHRLAYVPFPYRVDTQMFQELDLPDVLELAESGERHDLLLRGCLRFDFDATAGSFSHPVSHLTLWDPGCRIACSSAMTPGRFLRFIVENLYSGSWSDDLFKGCATSGSSLSGDVMEVGHKYRPHVAWFPVANDQISDS